MYFDETAWVAIAFVIFIALVWRKGSKAITGILDSRSLLIENELKEAILLAKENGAKGVAFYEGNNLTKEHLTLIKELKGSLNK